MTDLEADIVVATDVVEAWGALARPPRLVQRRENVVFEVALADGRRCALRLHRRGYQSPSRLRAEMLWTEALADAAFPSPWPQRTRAGDVFARARDGRMASLVQWLDGTPIGPTDTPSVEVYGALGALLADLHLTSDAVAPEGLDRQCWDAAAFCDPQAPLWGRYWENPALTDAESARLLATRDAVRARLDTLSEEDVGLIHADVLQENVLSVGPELFLIDFDDGGYGDRRYDLATALIQHAAHPAYADLRRALAEGYTAAGGPSEPEGEVIDLFVLCRALASCGWSMTRLDKMDERQRMFAERALSLSRDFLDA